MKAYTKDGAELSRARHAKRRKAQERLEARRAKLAERHKAQLAAAGAPDHVVEAVIKEAEAQAQQDFKEREEQELELDRKEAEEAESKRKTLAEKLEAAEKAGNGECKISDSFD